MGAVKKGAASIRRMERRDIGAVLALNRQYGGKQSLITYKEMVATEPAEPLDFSFVSEAEGEIIGFVLARMSYLGAPFTGEVCVIHGMVVAPEYQRLGIGSALIDELLSYCYDEGVNTARAFVEDTDKRLKRFVERLGFHRSPVISYDKTFEG